MLPSTWAHGDGGGQDKYTRPKVTPRSPLSPQRRCLHPETMEPIRGQGTLKATRLQHKAWRRTTYSRPDTRNSSCRETHMRGALYADQQDRRHWGQADGGVGRQDPSGSWRSLGWTRGPAERKEKGHRWTAGPSRVATDRGSGPSHELQGGFGGSWDYKWEIILVTTEFFKRTCR